MEMSSWEFMKKPYYSVLDRKSQALSYTKLLCYSLYALATRHFCKFKNRQLNRLVLAINHQICSLASFHELWGNSMIELLPLLPAWWVKYRVPLLHIGRGKL